MFKLSILRAGRKRERNKGSACVRFSTTIFVSRFLWIRDRFLRFCLFRTKYYRNLNIVDCVLLLHAIPCTIAFARRRNPVFSWKQCAKVNTRVRQKREREFRISETYKRTIEPRRFAGWMERACSFIWCPRKVDTDGIILIVDNRRRQKDAANVEEDHGEETRGERISERREDERGWGERRSTRRGREFAGAWNPVISATKRAVHLAGARWHVSTPSSERRVIRSSWWTSRAACTLQPGGATMLQISTGETVIYIYYICISMYIYVHNVSPRTVVSAVRQLDKPCETLEANVKIKDYKKRVCKCIKIINLKNS